MSRLPPSDIVNAAQSAQEAWRIPASVLLAQWALESGWGEHMPPGSNNPFGEKALPGDPSVAAATTEVVAGHIVPTNAPFRAFPSIAEAFDFHAEHLATSHYFIAARACLPDVEAFCHALTGVYATDPHYGDELVAVIRGSRLDRYDRGAPPQPSASPTMSDVSAPTPAPAPTSASPGPIQAATLDMTRSALMAAGGIVAAHGFGSSGQWQTFIGGLIALTSMVWSYIAAHPSQTSALVSLLGMVRRGGQAGAWNGDVTALEAALLPLVEKTVDAQIKARAGLLAGPVDLAANAAIRDAAGQAAGHLKIV